MEATRSKNMKDGSEIGRIVPASPSAAVSDMIEDGWACTMALISGHAA